MEKENENRKIYLNLLKEYRKGYEQEKEYEIADTYIRKIWELCREHQTKFYLLPGPTSESKREGIQSSKASYADSWLGAQFPEFLDQIYYFPDEEAKDLTHFSGEYANQNHFNETLRQAYGQTALIQGLALDGEQKT